MENRIEIFKNEQFGEVRVAEINGEPWFVGKDVANVLGYAKPLNALSSHVDEDDSLKQGLTDSLGRMQETIFINESGLYSLVLSSKLESAKQFKKWVTSEVLPSIRKHGLYAVDELIANPELAIAAFTALKEEREKNALLTKENTALTETVVEQKKTIEYKEDVIVGLVKDIDLATQRQRIGQIIKHRIKDASNISKRWNLLYNEFEKKYHVNLSVRFDNHKDDFKPKLKNKLDVIDRQMHMIPELYQICCKLFENDLDVLMQEWEDTIAC